MFFLRYLPIFSRWFTFPFLCVGHPLTQVPGNFCSTVFLVACLSPLFWQQFLVTRVLAFHSLKMAPVCFVSVVHTFPFNSPCCCYPFYFPHPSHGFCGAFGFFSPISTPFFFSPISWAFFTAISPSHTDLSPCWGRVCLKYKSTQSTKTKFLLPPSNLPLIIFVSYFSSPLLPLLFSLPGFFFL